MTIFRRPDPIPRRGPPQADDPFVPKLRESGDDLNQRAARRIFLAIATRQWTSAEVLPTEEQLGREMGVSRTVIREAIKNLSGKSVVETRRRRGTAVVDATEWNLLDRQIIGWMSESNAFGSIGSDLLDALALSQPALAAKAAATTKGGRFVELAAKIAEASEDDRVTYALSFHLEIGRRAGNPFLRSLTAVTVAALESHHRDILKAFLRAPRRIEAYSRTAAAIHAADRRLAFSAAASLFDEQLEDIRLP